MQEFCIIADHDTFYMDGNFYDKNKLHEIFKELKGYFSYNTVYGNIESVLWNGGGIVAMGVFETDHRRYQ